MRYRQHRPDFVTMDDPPIEGDVATLAELLAVPFIAVWSYAPHFHRFSVGYHHGGPPDRCLLMAELDGGFEWWVVAWIFEPLMPDLPMWAPRHR